VIRGLLSFYLPSYPTVLVYMLQNTEYQAGPYLKWFWRTNDFRRVMYRRSLERTKAARLLLLALWLGVAAHVFLAALLIWSGLWQFGIAALVAYPLVLGHAVVLPLVLGRLFVIAPRERRLIQASEKIFRRHSGEKLAIAGSYGKTSLKELLLTVLSEGNKQVAATPANKNVAISHAYFARRLSGNEDIVIIEYGEGAPGDVARFAATTHPTRAIITGIAPAHLDHYKSPDQAADDIFSVNRFVPPAHVYVNGDSPAAMKYVQDGNQLYTSQEALGWKVTDIAVSLDGTCFTMTKGKQKLHLKSGLLGKHQVGPLAIAAALAHEFGLTPAQIEAGVAKTLPYEHRMQPYSLAGAWIIDDTYNGNIEGVRAGTALLKALDGTRKIYVTPGLVDQGAETRAVHEEMGRLIAEASPDIVVLMRNSATPHIEHGLQAAGYKHELQIVDDPLAFYTNLKLVVAAGDVVLMQNDWTDNYN
jgi:UDP-N-acetylmuramoyl-tripeptide--D-alanyl-D-alanine ligase